MQVGDLVRVTHPTFLKLYGISSDTDFKVDNVYGNGMVSLKDTTFTIHEKHLKPVAQTLDTWDEAVEAIDNGYPVEYEASKAFNLKGGTTAQDLEEAVEAIVECMVVHEELFTAYDVTKRVREANPNESFDHANVHQHIYVGLRQYLEDSGYVYHLVPLEGGVTATVYHPSHISEYSYKGVTTVWNLEEAVEELVTEWCDDKRSFTVWNVTRELRRQNPNVDISHNSVRTEVESLYFKSEMDDYARTVIEIGDWRPQLYHPMLTDVKEYIPHKGAQVLPLMSVLSTTDDTSVLSDAGVTVNEGLNDAPAPSLAQSLKRKFLHIFGG
jgi:hypothetical protein